MGVVFRNAGGGGTIWEKLDVVCVEYTVGVATESRNSKAWWGAGGVAAVGTGGVWGEGAKISYAVGNNIRLDKTALD